MRRRKEPAVGLTIQPATPSKWLLLTRALPVCASPPHEDAIITLLPGPGSGKPAASIPAPPGTGREKSSTEPLSEFRLRLALTAFKVNARSSDRRGRPSYICYFPNPESGSRLVGVHQSHTTIIPAPFIRLWRGPMRQPSRQETGN